MKSWTNATKNQQEIANLYTKIVISLNILLSIANLES